MLLSVDLVGLVLYCAQQLGVMLGVGAQAVLLVSYLVSQRDGIISAAEESFAHTIERVLLFGLALIVLSGIGIVVLHVAIGQASVLVAPAFLFKWILVICVLAAALMRRGKPFMHAAIEGAVGGTWFALFMLHILAPVAVWSDLLLLYICWMLVFMLCWTGIVYISRKKMPAVAPAKPVAEKLPVPKVIQPAWFAAPAPAKPAPPAAPAISKPIQLPAQPIVAAPSTHVPHKPITSVAPTPGKMLTPVLINLPAPHSHELAMPIRPYIAPGVPPHKPAEPTMTEIDDYLGLPALTIMPKTVEEIGTQNRGSTVQFSQE